jgi:hypothetical protein
MKNIEIFKSLSGLVMAELYDAFPLPITLKPSELALKLDDALWSDSLTPDPQQPHINNYNRRRSPAALSKPTIEWLQLAGLISYRNYRDSFFEGVVLTPKGLEAIESDQQRGQSLLQAAENLALDASKDIAKDQLKGIFSDVLKWCVEKSPSIIHTIQSIT